MISMGDQSKLTHLHTLSIEKSGERKDLKTIVVHENSLPTGVPDKKIVIEGEY